MKRVTVPFDLGGSNHRCGVRPPLRTPPDPVAVRTAVTEKLAAQVNRPGSPLEVAFFHGGLPSAALCAAARPACLRLSTSPVDLLPHRDQVVELVKELGLDTIEIEVLTFDDAVLHGCRRGYTGEEAAALIETLLMTDLRVGVVLSPGLPRATPLHLEQDLEQVHEFARPGVDFARVNPILALDGSDLAAWATAGRWTPLDVNEAVSQSITLVDGLEQLDIDVIRVGLQPGWDLPVPAVAGPQHSSLRGLVETQRFAARMETVLQDAIVGDQAVLVVNPHDLAWAKGISNENVRWLRDRCGLNALRLETDPTIPRGQVELQSREPATR